MKTLIALVAALPFALPPIATAYAACPTSAEASSTPKIAKDGSVAPLQTPKNAPGVTTTPKGTTTNNQAAGAGTGNKVQKNGQTMPLAKKQGGGDTNVATSDQDVEQQQKGGKTAAAKGTACD